MNPSVESKTGSISLDQPQPGRTGLRLIAGAAALIGVVDLLSAIHPGLPERINLLKDYLPFEVRASGHLLSAIIGFLLLRLSTKLLHRKAVAWLLAVILLVISIASHLLKGLDYEETILSLLLLIALLVMRGQFTARSDRPSVAQGIRILISALLFTLVYGTIGFYYLDRHYLRHFELYDALSQTIGMFFGADTPLHSATRYGRYFVDSIYLVGCSTLSYGLIQSLRPVLWTGAATAEERASACAIVNAYGQSVLSRFALFDDKSFFFSHSGDTVIAYVPKGRIALVLGDPIGPAGDRIAAIREFQTFCECNDWLPAYYQVPPESLPGYQACKYSVLKIGEEAFVNAQTFSLEGKRMQNLRTAKNRMAKLGYRFALLAPPIEDSMLVELRSVSDEWLRMVHGTEKRFSLGWFHEAYLRECPIAVLYAPTGEIAAFANLVATPQCPEVAVDLMRRRQATDNYAMDYLFVSIIEACPSLGFCRFNLGLSALTSVGTETEAPTLERLLNYLSRHLSAVYNFSGLHRFKEKYSPCWEPRYLVYPGLATLPDVIIALVRADSGDRLLDYFHGDD